MTRTCPYCGKVAAALRIGRAATNIGVTEVCDALRLCRSAPLAAEKLGRSRALIYKVLKANGLTPADVIKENATKDTRLLHKGIESD
jgi:hypothetical protein